jgi:septal ring factor EnvC (AmiA/AmiB activator)
LRAVAVTALVAVVATGVATGIAVKDAAAKDAVAQSGEPDAVQGRLESVREAIETDRKSAEALAWAAATQARELQSLRAELRAAARAVQSHEGALDTIESELAGLQGDAARKQDELDGRRAQLGGTLAALQRLSLRPTAALLVSPGDPNDVVRSGLLLRTAVPEIERQARILRDDIAELADLRNRIELRRGALQQAAVDLELDRGRLETLSGRKNDILQQTRGAQSAADARVTKLRGEAQTLEQLLSRLRDSTATAASQPRPGSAPADFVTPTFVPAGPSIASARGNLTPPAHGRVIQGYGDETIGGPQARGVTWQTRAEASVVAPWDGRIAFAGPFRRFGQILIIDHGEGYHTLIAGLGRIEAQVGQWVLAGEPLGRTADDANRPQGTGDGTKSGGQAAGAEGRSSGSKLYVELRHDGEPINPLPWLAAQTNRTQG